VRIDLHTHSTVSDGTESPAEVIAAAVAAGLDVVALTDHDSVSGWTAASEAAADAAIVFVPGIEVSCRHNGISIHLLGYWPDPDAPAFTRMIAATRDARIERAQQIVHRVAIDYPLTWEEVLVHSTAADTVGRPHIADALVAGGHFSTRDDAFADVLAGNSRYYVPHYAPDVVEAIRTVRDSGGVPVFAHPGADARGRVVPDAVVELMADAGLAGLEVDHRDHSPEQRDRLASLANRLGLLRTGASDYHGAGKLNRLGENLTSPEVFAELEAQRR
jgi:predicted metal-dependent phosphoesterase TrpH